MLIKLHTLALADGFWQQVLTSRLSIFCLAVMLACGLALIAGLIVMRRLHRHQPRANPITDSSGTATIEFALVFPILLFMMLMLTQTTTLMAGNIFVHYSAYAATRTAIVQVPTEYSDDQANRFTADPGHIKYDTIQRAAALALVPVGGRETEAVDSGTAEAFVNGLKQHYQAYGLNPPVWIDNFAADRLRYTLANTRVILSWYDDGTFIEIPDGGSHRYEARDPIATRVVHKLNLAVPYANRIYADGIHGDGPGRYRLVSARYVLTNEGVRDEMPPTPTVPRRTP